MIQFACVFILTFVYIFFLFQKQAELRTVLSEV
ncbi:MAG: CcmD family protein [Clostridia bacterium]|nr:CcmD family protein [Clostridia bacterium]MBR3838230.1 CcmD family protein [Clostridia bacterium]